MKFLPALIRPRVMRRHMFAASAMLACAIGAVIPARAQTPLADQPVFASTSVPGNLALVLSVEFPTAVSVAYTNRTYVPATQYLGLFDPNKCYVYSYSDGTSVNNFFAPASIASNHVCNISPATNQWSDNFLNWASMQTIDPFRWVLTGGYRVIDEMTRTVVEKANATGQGGTGNFPDATIGAAAIPGATPFPAGTATMSMRIQGLNNKMRFAVPSTSAGATFNAQWFNSKTLDQNLVLTETENSIAFNINGNYPGAPVPTTNVSARWTGTVTAPTDGDYTFMVRSDDGVRLWVDGHPLHGGVNVGWKDQGATNYYSDPYHANAGQNIPIVVEWYQGGGGAEISLSWLTPGATDYAIIGNATPSLQAGATPYNPTNALSGGVVYEAFIRAKVCDPALGLANLEANCKQYGANYKPEGLLQKYSNKIRYSAFGYLNDSNILRDGGILRAKQAFIGPTQPVPGSTPITNAGAEWDGSTGIFSLNPDAADAAATAGIMGLPSGSGIVNSGVMNYLNKFGELTPGATYKTYDNVSELYYAAIRYFKNQPDVNAWHSVSGASDSDKITWTDSFPVIVSPPDPILYSCQRNFILGIGDVNTHADKNLPGRVQSGNEPSLEPEVSADLTVDATVATDKVGALEGLGTIGTNATYNSYDIAGLAYDAHTVDIRGTGTGQPSLNGMQTIDTYWVDVMEYQTYASKNQFWLAAKYGGFTVPVGYKPYDAGTTAGPLKSAWSTSGDMIGSDPRPDNYYSGGQPDLMKAGLESAFAKIATALAPFTTSFSTSLPQVASIGNSTFSSKYDSTTWTGEVTAGNLSFDSTGAPTVVQVWNFTDILDAQLSGTGWDVKRRVVTWNGTAGVPFRNDKIDPTDLATLDTDYYTPDDRIAYLNYLRGDQSNELASTTTGSTHSYRNRTKLLGDIVGSKARPIGPPSFPFSDSTNPGYAAFKTTWASRRTVVYVGANDGMMHAINGALSATATTPPVETDTAAGTEMFAYVPRVLFRNQAGGSPNVDGLASLGKPVLGHHYMVNATPVVYDLDFNKTPGASGGPDWRSVLVGGLGKGGKIYYAIDVTDPVSMAASETTAAGKVLWEFSDPSLGYTFGDALITKTKKYGWVVILMSGYNNSDGKGYFIFVNPKTGALLEKVSTGAGDATHDAGLANGDAFIVDASDGTADSVYAGDLLGNFWRLDLTKPTGAYSAPVKIAYLTDPGVGLGQPVTSRPSIAVHPRTKKRTVMVGTGRLLDATDIASTQVQTFYAFTDGVDAAFTTTLPTGVNYPFTRANLTEDTDLLSTTTGPAPDTTKFGWFEDLGVDAGTPASGSIPAIPSTGIAWRVISDSTTLAGSVAFAAVLPSGDICNPTGQSRVYGRDFAVGTTTVKDVAGTSQSYVPLSGNVTDLRYLSVGGKATLIAGTDTGLVAKIDINPVTPLNMRRLNWREVQVVE